MTTKPPEIRIPFEFTSSGYDDPSFDVITRGSGSSLQDLTAAVKVIQFERDRLKSCKTYIVGYDQFNVQILKQDCIYEGIRDLHAAVASVSLFYDLPLYIKSNLSSYLDLATLVKGASNDFVDLVVGTKGWSLNNTLDLSSYIRQGLQASTDFTAYVKTFLSTTDNISSSLKGWKRSESDTLFGVLKGLKSEYEQISSYIKPNFSSTSDLSLDVFKIWHQSRTSVLFDIHGWQETNLSKYIYAISYTNLTSTIRATYLYDLASTMVAVPPLDLASNLYGWAVNDVELSIAYARSPYDFAFSINPISSVSLPVHLNAFLDIKVPKNLYIKIQSYYKSNLNAFINSVPAFDLRVTLFPKSVAVNLGASIYPKIVFVRTLLSVSYLECLNLAAAINSSCFGSSYSNLVCNLYSMSSQDLTASLFGTDGSNISDLNIFINKYDYYEENTLKLSVFKEYTKYTSVKLIHSTPKSHMETNIITLKCNSLVDNKYNFCDNTEYVGETGSYAAQSVWDDNFVAVYHMAPPFTFTGYDDVFNGSDNISPDNTKWSLLGTEHAVYLKDNSLKIFNANNSLIKGVTSVFDIVGDFDIQVDASRVEGTYSGEYEMFMAVTSKVDASDWAYITLCHWSGGEIGSNVFNNGVGSWDHTSGFSDLDFKLRIIRIGSKLTFKYLRESSNGWDTVSSNKSWVADDVTVKLACVEMDATFDNFKQNYIWQGAAVVDSTQNSYVGNINNYMLSSSFHDNTFSQGIEFNGTSDYITCNTLRTKFSTGDSFFLSCKIKITGNMSPYAYANVLFSAHTGDGINRLSIGVCGITGGVFISTQDDYGSSSGGQVFGINLDDGNAHRLAISIDGSGIKTVWIDDNLPISGYTSKQVGWFSVDRVSIGQEWDSATGTSDYFPGIITEMFISNIDRSSTQLKAIDDSFISIERGIESNKLKLTLDSSSIDEVLTDFPVRVNLNPSCGFSYFDASHIFEVLEENKFKLRLETEYGELCYTEIVSWDVVNKQAVLWAKVPLVSPFEDTVLTLTYPNIQAEKDKSNLSVSIFGAFVEANLPCFARAYTPLSYNMLSVKNKLITLKLNHHNVEEWRRHVEITFDKYVRSYYYFSGNQKVYKEFVDDQWVVQVKGYTTTNLPTGIDRSKVNRKYIFNLKKYSSIDAAIKDMIDRVTALKEYDLRYTINGVPKKEANLSMSIASRTVYKSNRRLPVSITPI